MKNKQLNQGVTETPAYIVIEIDYDNKLIMPVEKGMAFMETWANSLNLKIRYEEPPQLVPVKKEFKVTFMSEEKLKEVKMAAVIGSSAEDK